MRVSTTATPRASTAAGRGSGWREQTLVLCALIATVQMTWGVIVPALPLYVSSYGLTTTALGPILAAFAIGRALINTPAGWALRRWEPRRYLWITALGLAVVTAVTGFAQDTTQVIVLRFIAGLFGGAAVTVAFSVLVTAAPAHRRGKVVAAATMAMTAAAALGAVLGGIVVEVAGLKATFIAAALPLLLVLGWESRRPATRYWNAYAGAREPEPEMVSPIDSEARQPANRRSLVLALCGVSFSTFFVRFAGEQGLIPVLAYADAGLRPVTLSLALAAGTLISLLLTPWVGGLVDRGVRTPVLVASGVCGAAAVVSLPAAQSGLLFTAALIVYFCATAALNVVPGVVTGETWGPKESGAVVGLTRTVGDLGAAAGPLIVFWLVDATSNMVACALMGVLLLGTVLHFTAVSRRTAVKEAALS